MGGGKFRVYTGNFRGLQIIKDINILFGYAVKLTRFRNQSQLKSRMHTGNREFVVSEAVF